MRVWPTLYDVTNAHPELLVGLKDKIRAVLHHWVLVDEVLPPAHPLLLLENVDRESLAALLATLVRLGREEQAREVKVGRARAAYERQKRVVHEWVRDIYQWMRAFMQGTPWIALVGVVPGLGQSYRHWWTAAGHTQVLWELMEEEPPDISTGWPMEFGTDATLENYQAVVRSLEISWQKLFQAEFDLKVTRGVIAKTQHEATACLMAYGHGVRARLLKNKAMVDSIPPLWPRRVRPPRAKSARSETIR